MEGTGWINVAQHMNKRQAVLVAVMNLLVPYGTGIVLTS